MMLIFPRIQRPTFLSNNNLRLNMMVMVMIMMTIIHECTDKSLSSIGDDENVAQMLQKYFN